MCVPHTYYLLSLSFIWATACYAVVFPGVVAALVFGKVGVYLVRWRIFLFVVDDGDADTGVSVDWVLTSTYTCFT